MNFKQNLFTFCIVLSFVSTSIAQQLDDTFEMPLIVRQADVFCAEWLDNGKMLLGGRIHFYENTLVNHLIRLNADGSLDETFNNASGIGVVKTFRSLPTDDLIVGTNSHLYKLSADGSINSSVKLEDDDELKHIVLGENYILVGVSRNNTSYRISKYSLNLEQDDTFSTIVLNGIINDFKVHKDKILLTGFNLQLENEILSPVARLNMDGSIDDTFLLDIEIPSDYGSIENLFFKTLLIRNDDDILVQTNGYNGILKLDALGTQDLDFTFDDVVFRHVNLDEVHMDEAFNIYIVGHSNYYGDNDSYDRRILKYDSDGILDSNFEISLISEKNQKTRPLIEVDDSGNILLANINNLTNRYGLNKLSVDGAVDEFFLPEVGTYGVIDVAEIDDEQFVIAGDFNRLGAFISNDVAVLNLDGTVDESFQYLGSLERAPTDIGFYNGSIYLANESEVHKLQSDGSIDETFNSQPEFLKDGFSVVWFASNIHIQDDGKIVTTSPNGIFRMTASGEADDTYGPFFPSIGTTAYASDMEKDGKVVFGGYFDFMNDAEFSDMVRINTDGSFDDSFVVERDASQEFGPGITDITSLKNGETMVFGYFNRFGGSATPNRMVKLDRNGKVDGRFLKFVNETFREQVFGLKNYTSFRGGFVVAGYDQYFIVDDEFSFNYQLYAFNNSGIYQSKFELPEGYQATQAIIPLVINNNDVILISNFSVTGGDPTQGIRIKVNNLPKITNHVSDVVVTSEGFDLNYEHLEVEDSDNVYPDDFEIKIYRGDNFTLSGNKIIPNPGYTGTIEVPITVAEASNESNFVLIPMKIESDEVVAGIENSEIELFPNPTSDLIHIRNGQFQKVEILSLSGNLILKTFDNQKIDLSELKNGVYLIKLFGIDGDIYSQKIIKR